MVASYTLKILFFAHGIICQTFHQLKNPFEVASKVA